ncbi:MAG: DUF4968 domain-containing protein [Planctomycetes bacterium]|nr:DUF4968 domain-containing protein [Planctomycetota bacterium]
MSTIPNSKLVESEIPDGFGWRSLGAVTHHTFKGNVLTLDCGEAKLRISLERQGIVRVRLAQSGIFGRDHSWAVIADDAPSPAWKLDDENGHLTLITASLRIIIQKNPCRISFHALDGKFIAGHDASKGIAWDGNEVRCWMRLCDEDHFFGMGERGSPLDKRGQVLVNWNHDAAEHEPWTDPLYQSHPLVLVAQSLPAQSASLSGANAAATAHPTGTGAGRHEMGAGRGETSGQVHGLFFDNTFRATFDFGKTSTSRYSFGAEGGEMNYYFIPGPTAKDVIRRYGALVGTQPLPPQWALGYQQCRWSYESAKRARDIAKRLQASHSLRHDLSRHRLHGRLSLLHLERRNVSEPCEATARAGGGWFQDRRHSRSGH